MSEELHTQLEEIRQAIAETEARLRELLPAEQLEAALAPLREQEATLKAKLKGSGAIAQGEGATALGERSIKAREFRAATTGDNSPLTYVEQQVVEASATAPDPAVQARRRYLSRLRTWCNTLPLPALGVDESGDIGLEQVYIALDTRTQVDVKEGEKQAQPLRPDEKRPLSALEAATSHPRLVLLGDPGSGKSSFVRHLVAQLAAANLEENLALVPAGWPLVLPVFTVLRDLTPRLAGLELRGLSTDEQQRRLVAAVWELWRAELAQMQAADYAVGLEEALAAGQVLLVFDGLDEVPERVRERVRLAVNAILRTYPAGNRVIVTCRIRSYSGRALLPGFQAETLAPFDGDKIRDFIRAWYQAQPELSSTEKQHKTADLFQAATAGPLLELASNPMLLTTMAIIHQREVGLPRERVRLYAQAVQILLNRWQKHKGIPVSEALTEVLEDQRRLRQIMERLGYEAHRAQAEQGREADLSRSDMLVLLEAEQYLADAGLAAEFLDYVDQRAGLLVGRGGGSEQKPPLYSFPHRTFQEYLAGCYLVTGRDVARNYWQRLQEGDYWYLAAQLGAEELLYNKRSTTEFLDLAYALCPEQEPRSPREWRAVVWSGHLAQQLSPAEIEQDDHPGGGPAYWARIRPRLQQALSQEALPAIERVEAGRILARLGDPRPEVLTVDEMHLCFVPAGPFWMGSDENDPLARDSEKPLHQVDIPYGYWISRHPVTQAQFAEFVAAGGYREVHYWPEATELRYWRDGRFRGRWDDEQRDGPYVFGEPFGLDNHPVVGVSWYEALAFTRWLGEQWRASGYLPQDWHVRLPSEAEWEKAARGGLVVPKQAIVRPASAGFAAPDVTPAGNTREKRRFPWGDDAEQDQHTPGRCNDQTARVEATSAVGAFPNDRSPYGVREMAGNVKEWTHSLHKDYPYRFDDGREVVDASDNGRVIRGGAFTDDEIWLRCASRDGDSPYLGSGNFGFRVVSAPSPSGL